MNRRFLWLAPATLVSAGLLTLTCAAQSGDKGRTDVATCVKIEGALLRRDQDGKFKPVKAGDHLPPKTFLIGFPEGDLQSSCGKIYIDLHLYLGEALPVTEAAITLNDSPQLNADITIDRGVLGLKNLADKGAAVVRVRGPGDQSWLLTLQEPGTTVLVARFGRLEAGTKLFKTGGKKAFLDEPLMYMGVLVTKGSVQIDTGSVAYALKAPPGPALITWDSGTGYHVKQMDKLPQTVYELNDVEKKLLKDAGAIAKELMAGDLGKGLDAQIASKDAFNHRIAVACMGAIDDVPRLVAALENTTSPDVREQAVLTLRTWIGRQPGQLTKLYDYLTKEKKYTPVQGRTVAQLLRGFDDDDRKEPHIYQLLIDGMEFAPQLSIRELAYWNLTRLAPAGQQIAYDAAASQEARSQAAAAWRKLIPDGQLPPAPKKVVPQ